MSLPSVLAERTIRRRPFSRAIWFGPSPSSIVASVESAPHRRRRSAAWRVRRHRAPHRAAHDEVEAAVAFDHLRDPLAVDHLLERTQQRARRNAVACRLVVVDADLDLRNQHLLLDLQVGDAGDLREPLAQLRRQAAQRVEIVAVDLQRDLGAHAGQQVVEAVRDRLADVAHRRQHREAAADVGDDLVAAALGGFQVDVHLAVVHALGMFVEFGAAGAAADLRDLGHGGDDLLGERADPVRLGKRRARV
jgi:hypothetical protein